MSEVLGQENSAPRPTCDKCGTPWIADATKWVADCDCAGTDERPTVDRSEISVEVSVSGGDMEYEAYYTGGDGLRWHVSKGTGRKPILALESQLASGDAMGMLFDSEEAARKFCAKHFSNQDQSKLTVKEA